MINPGQVITTMNGYSVMILDFLSAGGQARIYIGKIAELNCNVIVKEFFDKFHTTETEKRMEYLVNQGLYKLSPVICSPFDFFKNGTIGNVSFFAEGIPLREFLEMGNPNLVENLQLAIVIVSGIDVLHRMNIAMGDLHPDNVLIKREGSVLKAKIIDFDNFSAPNQPLPPMSGHPFYIAPEIRKAYYERGHHLHPNIHTDLYSLSLILHEIILLKFNYQGSIDDENSLYEAQKLGKWLQDPAFNTCTDKSGGFKSEILTPALSRLFRRSFVLNSAERPSTSEWLKALVEAFKRVCYCKSCDYQFINDIDKIACPDCGVKSPNLMLITDSGIRIPVDSGRVLAGRDNLGGSLRVSSIHAVFRKEGFQTYVIPMGQNGTYSRVKNKFERLPDGVPVEVYDGDILRMADLTIRVQSEV
ncbi:MAG: hypothetical protein ABRQ39_25515 [Candidatus Eremiobacterota bacterium]